MRYTLDTNILINMVNRYPRDLFASLWESMEGAVASGEICVCEVILKELECGDDNLAPWVKSVPGFVCKTTDDELITAAGISSAHPDWVRGQKNYGDPFIIAHAKAEGSIIVTEEARRGPGTIDKNQKIPNIAEEHRITCINFLDLLRARGWRF